MKKLERIFALLLAAVLCVGPAAPAAAARAAEKRLARLFRRGRLGRGLGRFGRRFDGFGHGFDGFGHGFGFRFGVGALLFPTFHSFPDTPPQSACQGPDRGRKVHFGLDRTPFVQYNV